MGKDPKIRDIEYHRVRLHSRRIHLPSSSRAETNQTDPKIPMLNASSRVSRGTWSGAGADFFHAGEPSRGQSVTRNAETRERILLTSVAASELPGHPSMRPFLREIRFYRHVDSCMQMEGHRRCNYKISSHRWLHLIRKVSRRHENYTGEKAVSGPSTMSVFVCVCACVYVCHFLLEHSQRVLVSLLDLIRQTGPWQTRQHGTALGRCSG